MATEVEWSCLRKRRFPSRQKARQASRLAQRQFGPMRPYRCPHGTPTHWHVGHDWRERESRDATLSRSP